MLDPDAFTLIADGPRVMGLKYGLVARIVDLPDDTNVRPPGDKTTKCPLTGLSAWSCQCWSCQGKPMARWTRPEETKKT